MFEVYAPPSIIDYFKGAFNKVKIRKVRFVDADCDCYYQFFVKIKIKKKKYKKAIILIKPDAVAIEYKDHYIHTNIIPINVGSFEFPWDYGSPDFFDMAFIIISDLEAIGFEGATYTDFKEYVDAIYDDC